MNYELDTKERRTGGASVGGLYKLIAGYRWSVAMGWSLSMVDDGIAHV